LDGLGSDPSRQSSALRQLEHESEPLSADVQLQECLLLGLRLAEGVDLEHAAARIGANPWPAARRRAATRLIERGRLLQQGSRLVIPKPAWLFSDGIISELL
jgi:oxygen-independent coproporphyrinogen-3 oxidase